MNPSMRFLRHGGIYRSDMGQNRFNPGWLRRLPLVGTRAPVKERDGRSTSCSSASSAMSSGRLFLDRVARQHCPSPLHRQLHPKTVPGWGTMKWQRTAHSVLTVCLTKRDSRKSSRLFDRSFAALHANASFSIFGFAPAFVCTATLQSRFVALAIRYNFLMRLFPRNAF